MCAMAFDVTLTELASLSSRLITFEGPYLSNTVDGTLKKRPCAGAYAQTHTHTPLPGLFRCHELKEHSMAQAYLMESSRGQAGTDGLRTAGYWE